ncbi:MAG: DUF6194 family protein [Pyrinomonadaceae bacterium]|nr:DUF6194 family protein [Pyrinomonadaceae bacterium]
MTIEEIKDYIFQNFRDINLLEADGDLFFMHKSNDKLPFATIVTGDNEYDNFSNLNREGFFRINIGIDKETFNSMFEGLTSKKGMEAYLDIGIDFTKENIIQPHPTYGNSYWICVVNPSDKLFETLKQYLKISYDKISKND